MKKALKFFTKFIPIFLVTFVSIYLLVFFGGWKFFESGDPILMEIGVSVLVAIIFYVMDSLYRDSKVKIEELEKRIDELEALMQYRR